MSSVHQDLVLQGCLICVLCVPSCCGSAKFAFMPVICIGSLCMLWAEFGPCIICGPVWSCLVFGLDQAFSRNTVALNYRALSLCCVLRSFSFSVMPALDQMSAPSPLLGPQGNWSVWLTSPLPGVGVILEWCCPLSGLISHSQVCGIALKKSTKCVLEEPVHRSGVCSASKISATTREDL